MYLIIKICNIAILQYFYFAIFNNLHSLSFLINIPNDNMKLMNKFKRNINCKIFKI